MGRRVDLRIIIPHGRPDVMLVEIKTLYGPVRLSMPKSVALTVGRSITAEAEKLAPDGSLSWRRGTVAPQFWPAGSGVRSDHCHRIGARHWFRAALVGDL